MRSLQNGTTGDPGSIVSLPIDSIHKTKSKKRKKPQASNSNRSISKTLFEAYDNTEDILTKSAINLPNLQVLEWIERNVSFPI
jgi:hypothetical protein